MKNMQKGFTLIELMIVVAIIGILAAIALPAYQDYTIRSKMSETLLVGSSCRTSITEVVQSASSLPGDDGWGCEASGTGPTKYVASVETLSNAGTAASSIRVVVRVRSIASVVNDGAVVLKACANANATTGTDAANGTNAAATCDRVLPTGTIGTWLCGPATDVATADGASQIAPKYLPGSCRVGGLTAT